jgi:hypothetical protein
MMIVTALIATGMVCAHSRDDDQRFQAMVITVSR